MVDQNNKKLKYPFYRCLECSYDIAELKFPIHPKQQYPKCPICHSVDNVDIVIGNEDTVLGNENTPVKNVLSLDTVIYSENVKGSGGIG